MNINARIFEVVKTLNYKIVLEAEDKSYVYVCSFSRGGDCCGITTAIIKKERYDKILEDEIRPKKHKISSIDHIPEDRMESILEYAEKRGMKKESKKVLITFFGKKA